MIRTAAAIVAFLGLTTPVEAAGRRFEVQNDPKSWAGFRIDDTLETVEGTTNKIHVVISLDTEDLAASAVAFNVNLATLETGIGLRDSEMRDTLETSKHPVASFKSTAVVGGPKLAAGEPVEVKVAGDFTLHGVTRRVNCPVRLVMTAPNKVRATGQFTIRMTDFDIEVPDKLVVSVANEVLLRFDVTATAK